MATPGLGDVHVSSPLSRFAWGYKSPKETLTRAFPVVSVPKENDTYYKFQAGDFYRDEAAVRAPDGEFTYIDWNYDTDTFKTAEWSAAKRIPDRVRRQADAAIKDDIGATRRVMDKLVLSRERNIATALTTTGNWGAHAASSGFWDQGSGDPYGQIETGSLTVFGSIGAWPNTMAMNMKAFRGLRRHPASKELLGVFYGTGKRGVNAAAQVSASLELIAEETSIKNIIICEGLYNSAAKGQTATLTDIMTDSVWIGYVAETPAIDEPSAGYVLTPEGDNGIKILQWREAWRTSDVVGGLMNYVVEITGAAAGYVLTNVLA